MSATLMYRTNRLQQVGQLETVQDQRRHQHLESGYKELLSWLADVEVAVRKLKSSRFSKDPPNDRLSDAFHVLITLMEDRRPIEVERTRYVWSNQVSNLVAKLTNLPDDLFVPFEEDQTAAALELSNLMEAVSEELRRQIRSELLRHEE